MKMNTRVIFMGTPDFAVPSLEALTHNGYDVVCVVTQPDRPVGRKQILTPSPVKVAAERLGLPVFQPEKVRHASALAHLADLQADVCVTAAYGQILPQALLDIPRVGCLNVHASLLPRWRGAAPIHRAILEGDAETGITIMEMVLALDAGPVVGVKGIQIRTEDNVGTLHDQLAEAGADLLLQVLPGYLNGTIQPSPQPEDGVTYAERITRKDEFLDWSWPVERISNHIRGLAPWPGATTSFDGKPMKIWSATIDTPALMEQATVGQVVVEHGRVFARSGDGWVELMTVQPSGKKKMNAADWVRGLQTDAVCFDKEVVTP